ncbi:HAD family hydrolase [Actinotalea ferrariae CF5-4]|uniref:HAD family hydrolase n=1 Tax=Actinotalea ferrariae CF5-4 TaxID=948458 RepID=A0A021VWN7_9CELL|nr:HAD family hydrolase [Actinotalea ferrariae]EYR63477.1 HAD family hydrolase [Actinotalea ferrariae CF5-4]
MTAVPDAPAVVLPAPEAVADVRLVTVDMDGTLLDADHELPEALEPLLAELARRDVLFCPASGRQYANLAARFGELGADLPFIAENGAFVLRGGQEISSDVMEPEVVADVVATVRDLAASGVDVGVVVCGKRSAYVERRDPAFRAEVDRYYTLLTEVEDVLAVDDDVLKVAVFDVVSAEATVAPALERFRATHQVVVSGAHWVDVLGATTHKGAAVRRLQEAYGITPAQTMAFGDYLNDLEMLDAAELSFAMANAHPEVLGRARYVAPAHTEDGVVRTLAGLLGLDLPGVAALPGR